jgi:deoxycytidine triphosphate deaminase
MAENAIRSYIMTDRAIATGKFVAEYLNDGDVPNEQIQPNGVDLTVGEVFRTSGFAEFSESGYTKPDRTKLTPHDDGYYRLYTGQYPIVYGEKVEIPDGYVARVYPRSRLMRSGLHLTSALWDQGYEGVGEGLLRVPRAIKHAKIADGLPIAQMTFISAEAADDYDGSHQSERLKVTA